MAPGTTFVHDFAGVDRPLEAVLGSVHRVLSADSLRALVLRAWAAEAAALASEDREGLGDPVSEGWSLAIEAGPPRVRRDATAMPVSWSGGEAVGLPPIEADVEFTAFGDDRTHIHLYGRTATSSMGSPGSQQGSLASRVAVAVVRRFLHELVDALESTIASDVQRDVESATPESSMS